MAKKRGQNQREIAIDHQVMAVRARLSQDAVRRLSIELGWSVFQVEAVCKELRYDIDAARRLLSEGDRLTLGTDIIHKLRRHHAS